MIGPGAYFIHIYSHRQVLVSQATSRTTLAKLAPRVQRQARAEHGRVLERLDPAAESGLWRVNQRLSVGRNRDGAALRDGGAAVAALCVGE